MNLTAQLTFILPEAILLAGGIFILMLGAFAKNKSLLGPLALLTVAAALLSVTRVWGLPSSLFFSMLANDPFSLFFKTLCLCICGIVIFISMGYKALNSEYLGEYYFLLLSATVSMLLLVSSNNLMMVYISLEMLSLISYILVGFLKRDALSSEAALKYFLFGALSTGIMLYGISLLYGLCGTTDLSLIGQALRSGQANAALTFIILTLILAGISFKCAFVPFHMWAPDVYQGAPTAITAFISVGPKAAGFAVLVRLFSNSFSPLGGHWIDVMTLVSIFTMSIGNIIAISQTDIKRLLAYSSIAQAGYMLIGFVVGTSLGIQGVLFYILAYALMNLGAFGCVVLISGLIKSDSIEDYAGLHKRFPGAAFMLTLFLLSLAGVPPLAGFLGKFLVFAAAIQSRFILLAAAGVINSVIAAFYYVKVIKYMYLNEPPENVHDEPRTYSVSLKIALAIMLIGVLIVGIYPHPFLHWISASQSFF